MWFIKNLVRYGIGDKTTEHWRAYGKFARVCVCVQWCCIINLLSYLFIVSKPRQKYIQNVDEGDAPRGKDSGNGWIFVVVSLVKQYFSFCFPIHLVSSFILIFDILVLHYNFPFLCIQWKHIQFLICVFLWWRWCGCYRLRSFTSHMTFSAIPYTKESGAIKRCSFLIGRITIEKRSPFIFFITTSSLFSSSSSTSSLSPP